MAGSLQVLGTCGSGDAGQTVRIPMHQTLNCLRGGIGGGIVPSNVYWNMGPRCPFASIAIGMRSLLLRSKSPMTASPGTGGSALVLLVLLSFSLLKS